MINVTYRNGKLRAVNTETLAVQESEGANEYGWAHQAARNVSHPPCIVKHVTTIIKSNEATLYVFEACEEEKVSTPCPTCGGSGIAPTPPGPWVDKKSAYRAANIADGLCSEGKQHGPPTRGKVCESCYQYNLERTRARRARKRASTQ